MIIYLIKISLKTSSRNARIFCATDIARLGLASAFPVGIETHTCTLTLTIKAVQSELFCISSCGDPGLRSCTNTNHIEGISIYKFLANEEQRKMWIKFVQKHRPNFIRQ